MGVFITNKHKHDKKRIDALVKTLRKAVEQAETAGLYVTDSSDVDDVARLSIAYEHIQTALGTLNREDDGQACRVCGCTQHHACPQGCWWVEPDLCSSCVASGNQEGEVHALDEGGAK